MTGDGQPYRVTVREKDKSFWGGTLPVWQAEFPTKDGERTVVELPLDKETWHEVVNGQRVDKDKGNLPEWSKLQGLGLMVDSADMHGDPSRKNWPFKITVHSIGMIAEKKQLLQRYVGSND